MATSDDQRQQEARNLQAGSPRFESGTAHFEKRLLQLSFRLRRRFRSRGPRCERESNSLSHRSTRGPRAFADPADPVGVGRTQKGRLVATACDSCVVRTCSSSDASVPSNGPNSLATGPQDSARTVDGEHLPAGRNTTCRALGARRAGVRCHVEARPPRRRGAARRRTDGRLRRSWRIWSSGRRF
jgi:hypothetical protein